MKLSAKAKAKANDKLYDVCASRLPNIPIADFDRILQEAGLQPTEPAIYCGREGQTTCEVGADNSVLWFSWLKGDHDGKYEIVAYLS